MQFFFMHPSVQEVHIFTDYTALMPHLVCLLIVFWGGGGRHLRHSQGLSYYVHELKCVITASENSSTEGSNLILFFITRLHITSRFAFFHHTIQLTEYSLIV